MFWLVKNRTARVVLSLAAGFSFGILISGGLKGLVGPIGVLLINLHTSSASHAVAASLITTGAYALPFWLGVVGVGVLLPLAWQGLELSHKVAHTVLPAVLVLAGGFTLRWVMVNAGQMSELVATPGL